MLSHIFLIKIGDFDDLKLLSVIGQGSFGTVHRALWRGMLVAAKIIPVCENQDKIQKEIELCR